VASRSISWEPPLTQSEIQSTQYIASEEYLGVGDPSPLREALLQNLRGAHMNKIGIQEQFIY
jgi:hypothetical protein